MNGNPVFKDDGTLDRSSLQSVCNPCDMRALEIALSFSRAEVTVLSMGPLTAAEVLKDALYRGADKAILLSDSVFAGADTLATSRVLSVALKTVGPDLILCGDYSVDGGTSQVGPEVAAMLGIPDIRSARSIKRVKDGIRIEVPSGNVTLSQRALVSVSDSAPKCRPCNIRLYMKYHGLDCVKVLSAKDLGLSKSMVGITGSCIYVKRVEPALKEKKDRVVTYDIEMLYKEGLL